MDDTALDCILWLSAAAIPFFKDAVSGIVSYDLSHERGLKKESYGREIRYSVKK